MSEIWYCRPGTLVAIARDTSYLFVVAGSIVLIEDVDVDELSRILALTARPILQADLLTHCSNETLDTLLNLGVLVQTHHAEPIISDIPKRCRRLVIGLSGSVAVTGALTYVVPLARMFAEHTDIIITAGASQFIEPRVFDYHGIPTWLDLHEPRQGVAIPHKYLADADLILIAPASANTIQRLATGACSDLLSLVVAMTKAPVVVAPSMNPQMWSQPAIARNVAQLRRDGIWVIDPGLGFPLSDPDHPALGAMGFDLAGLVRALDGVLTQHAASLAQSTS
ncbi:MAG: hypothetical protein NT062_34605 [Proteobacteria bacterium]|nr:hypothetical protein [Pseudomonadota bacterium]